MSATIHFIDLLIFLGLTLLLALAISVYTHNRRSPVNRRFSLFMFNVILWFGISIFYYFFWDLIPSLLVVQTAIGVFMGPVFYYFSLVVADEKSRLRPRDWSLLAVSAGIASWYVIMRFTPGLFNEFSRHVWFDGQRLHRPGDLPYIAYSVWLVTCFFIGYAVLWKSFRRERDPQNRRRIIHVLAASIIGQISTILLSNVLSIAGLGQLGRLNMFPILAALCWVSYSIIRHRIWTVEYLLDLIRESEKKLLERNRIIEADLELARLVQRRLLPATLPRIPGLAIHAVYLPMDKVGGDYYDFLEEDGTLGIIIADVSGHGIASAFLSSIIKMGVHYHGGTDAPALLRALDGLVIDKGARAMFATAAICRIDPAAMTLSCSRAGHCPPLLLRRSSNQVTGIEPRGRALGLNLGAQSYETSMMDLEQGDRLLLYTDGIIETKGAGGELFGENRLVEFVRQGVGLLIEDFCDGLLERLDQFAEGKARGDDITFIVVDVMV